MGYGLLLLAGTVLSDRTRLVRHRQVAAQVALGATPVPGWRLEVVEGAEASAPLGKVERLRLLEDVSDDVDWQSTLQLLVLVLALR